MHSCSRILTTTAFRCRSPVYQSTACTPLFSISRKAQSSVQVNGGNRARSCRQRLRGLCRAQRVELRVENLLIPAEVTAAPRPACCPVHWVVYGLRISSCPGRWRVGILPLHCRRSTLPSSSLEPSAQVVLLLPPFCRQKSLLFFLHQYAPREVPEPLSQLLLSSLPSPKENGHSKPVGQGRVAY